MTVSRSDNALLTTISGSPVNASMIERALVPSPRADERAPCAAGTFYRGAATFPWRSHAIWFLTQMLRWRQIDAPVDFAGVSAAVYRCDVYREAAEPLGIPVPLVDVKDEGVHDGAWLLGEATSPIVMGPDSFLDHRTFEPGAPLEYLARFAAQPAAMQGAPAQAGVHRAS